MKKLHMTKPEITKDGEKTVNITISLDEKGKASQSESPIVAKPLFVDEARLLNLANLIVVAGERNTEHGLTPVRLVEFRDDAQRQKIIRMLAESFEQSIETCIPYLIILGAHPRAAIRNRAAQTVGELMRDFDFIRYKEKILIPWAINDNVYMNSCVGLALAVVADDPRYQDNVKALVRHWVTSPNRNFNWTGVASCASLGAKWPEDTLDLLELALKREQIDLLVLALIVAGQLCQAEHADLVLARLSEWLDSRESNLPLRNAAALIFLEAIELSHITKNPALVDYAVDIFLIGLNDRRLTEAGLVRTGMLEKLKSWAESSFADPDQKQIMETLFTRLYVRAATPRDKERIAFHVQRWQQKDMRFAQFAHNLVQ
jgi:hypothetical protein